MPHASNLLDELCLKGNKRVVSPHKFLKFLKSFDISIGRSRETKEIRTASWSFNPKSGAINRYHAEAISALVQDVLTTAPRSLRVDSMLDSIELTQLAELTKNEALFKNIAIAAAQKYCDRLEKRIFAMKARQTRQTAGLLELLNKSNLKNN